MLIFSQGGKPASLKRRKKKLVEVSDQSHREKNLQNLNRIDFFSSLCHQLFSEYPVAVILDTIIKEKRLTSNIKRGDGI